jgi:hypothetical protein
MVGERIARAYLFAYAFVRPESEQNSSYLQIDCDRGKEARNHRGQRLRERFQQMTG